jgi:hypothetical protein
MITQLKNLYLKQGYVILPNLHKKEFEKCIYPIKPLSIYNIPHLYQPHTFGTFMKTPPSILTFDCIENTSEFKITLVDSLEIKNMMPPHRRTLYSRIPFKWSRKYNYYNAPIIDIPNNIFRFNESDLNENQVSDVFITKIKNIIYNYCQHTNIVLNPENTIFINNHRILHSQVNYTYDNDFVVPNTFIPLY